MTVLPMKFGAPVALPMLAWALSGCGGLSDASYDLEPGVASYDALQAATAACHAKGGELRLHGGGVEGQNLSEYQCAIGKAR
jgi:hypothetical protein